MPTLCPIWISYVLITGKRMISPQYLYCYRFRYVVRSELSSLQIRAAGREAFESATWNSLLVQLHANGLSNWKSVGLSQLSLHISVLLWLRVTIGRNALYFIEISTARGGFRSFTSNNPFVRPSPYRVACLLDRWAESDEHPRQNSCLLVFICRITIFR